MTDRVPYFTDGTPLLAVTLNRIIDLCYERMVDATTYDTPEGVAVLIDASPIEPSEILDLIRKGYRVHAP